MKIDKSRGTVDLDPRDPPFFNDPYPVYDQIRNHFAAFFWQQFGLWCFIGFDDVNRLLRDKRFGRQILHLASRSEHGLLPQKKHLRRFDAIRNPNALLPQTMG